MDLLQMKVVVLTAKIVLTLNTELTQPENKTIKKVGNIKTNIYLDSFCTLLFFSELQFNPSSYSEHELLLSGLELLL